MKRTKKVNLQAILEKAVTEEISKRALRKAKSGKAKSGFDVDKEIEKVARHLVNVFDYYQAKGQ